MKRESVRIIAEPRGSLYRRLIELAMEKASTAYLVVRPTLELDDHGLAAVSRLEIHELGRRDVSAWPGTTLLKDKARLLEYRLSAGLASVLVSLANGLYDWQQPSLPEDLGFVRADGSVFLASIAHERDSFLELSKKEEQDLILELPELSGFLDAAGGKSPIL